MYKCNGSEARGIKITLKQTDFKMFSNRWRRETNPDFWCNQQQVCVQIPTSADNVALPTSGRCTPLWCDCCWPPACCAAIDWYLLAARPTAANRQQQRTTARWDRQRQLDWHKTVSICSTMQAMRNNKYWQWEYESDPALPVTTVHNDILWAHWCLCVWLREYLRGNVCVLCHCCWRYGCIGGAVQLE